MRRFLIPLAGLALAAMLCGCNGAPTGPQTGGTPGETPTESTPSPSSPAPGTPTDEAEDAEGRIRLTIDVMPDGDPANTITYMLRCRGAEPHSSSDHPDPEAACAALDQHGELAFFSMPNPDVVCTQQFGGPQRAHVTGEFRGRTVDRNFNRTDGCEISTWDSLAPVFAIGGVY
jgi:hypothetical protein